LQRDLAEGRVWIAYEFGFKTQPFQFFSATTHVFVRIGGGAKGERGTKEEYTAEEVTR
jgi:hypothetical protein